MNLLKKHTCMLSWGMLLLTSCAKSIIQMGEASYYSDGFIGKKTANGEIFTKYKK